MPAVDRLRPREARSRPPITPGKVSSTSIDVWAGGLAEDHLPGAALGPLLNRVIGEQFWRLREADWFYYERALSSALVNWINGQTLSVIIRRNTEIDVLPSDVFHTPSDS